MIHRARLAVVVAALQCAALVGCLPGPEGIRARVTAELVVSGLDIGDVVWARVAGGERSQIVDEAGLVVMGFDLPRGAHEGALRVERDEDALCARFTMVVDEVEPATRAFERDALTPCDEQIDAGVDAGEADAGPVDDAGTADAGGVEVAFVAIEEASTGPGQCDAGACTTVTRVEGSGEISVVEDDGDAWTAIVPEDDLVEIATLLVSPEVDLLFSEGCTTSPSTTSIVLTRERALFDDGLAEIVVDTLDTTGCGASVLGVLRGRLQSLRSTLEPDDERSIDGGDDR